MLDGSPQEVAVVTLWLTDILNAAVDLEVVPDVLKCGMVMPVYNVGERK